MWKLPIARVSQTQFEADQFRSKSRTIDHAHIIKHAYQEVFVGRPQAFLDSTILYEFLSQHKLDLYPKLKNFSINYICEYFLFFNYALNSSSNFR